MRFLDKSFTSSLVVRYGSILLFAQPICSTWYYSAAPDPDAKAVSNPAGQVPSPFTFAFSQVPATPLAGGSLKIADSRTFPIATSIAVSQVSVQPGAMRYTRVSTCIPLIMTDLLSSQGASLAPYSGRVGLHPVCQTSLCPCSTFLTAFL